MASGVVDLVFEDFTVTFLDATGTPVDLPLIWDGTGQFGDIANVFEEIGVYAVSGGSQAFRGSRRGARKSIEISFAANVTSFTSAGVTDATGNPLDFIKRTNGFSANVNTNTTGFDFDMIDIKFSATVNSVVHSVVFAKCAVQSETVMGEPNKFNFSAVCRGGATVA